MFRKLIKNKKAQNTAEYAILIAMVVAAVIAMQTYGQRAYQARIKGAAGLMSLTGVTTNMMPGGEPWTLGTSQQYEPYYLNSQYDVTRREEETETLTNERVGKELSSNRTRAKDGGESSIFNIRVQYNGSQ